MNLTVVIGLVLLSQPFRTFADEWICERIVPSETVRLRDPVSLCISLESVLYVADQGHNRVVALDTTGRLLVETGGRGTSPGRFLWPRQVAASANGVFVLDYGNRRIERFSRALEHQGTITIPGNRSEARVQPEIMAAAPQGDLYVYERDSGRLLRLDPLFRVVTEIGGERSAASIGEIAAMTFVPSVGLVWWERGQATLRFSDAMLNISGVRPLPRCNVVNSLVAWDTCAVVVTDSTFSAICGERWVMLQPISWPAMGLPAGAQVTSLTFGAHHVAWALDGRTGSIYKLSRRRE